MRLCPHFEKLYSMVSQGISISEAKNLKKTHANDVTMRDKAPLLLLKKATLTDQSNQMRAKRCVGLPFQVQNDPA